jgi:hypothetical protein
MARAAQGWVVVALLALASVQVAARARVLVARAAVGK